MNKRIKSKFPLAKIKKIIQANEEIGKMQNAMPNIICKSLELFLTDLLTESMKVAQENGKNKLTGPCLKKVIDSKENLKFLKQITDNFADLENEQKKKIVKRSSKDEGKEGQEYEKVKKKVKKGKKIEEISD